MKQLESIDHIPEDHIEQIQAIAKMCHEVNQAYTAVIREPLKHWHELEQQEKDGVIEHVAFLIINIDADAKAWHDAWVAKMIVAGWKYGPKRSIKSKTHEHLKPFHHLPEKQQVKDALF
ncbi:MAG: RyR domain-containing protein, partial [Pseudoalteromonas tetraodonis]